MWGGVDGAGGCGLPLCFFISLSPPRIARALLHTTPYGKGQRSKERCVQNFQPLEF